MIQASMFYNVFTDTDAIPSKHDPNVRIIPTNTFLSTLSTICENNGLQYSWVHKSSGRFTNGLAFYNGELVITQRDEEGNIIDQITRAGSAESGQHNGNLGISGISTVALQNAALRGLRMAEFLYGEEEVPPQGAAAPGPAPHPYAQQVTPPNANPPAYQQPPQQQPPPQGGYQPQRYGNRPFTPRGGQAPGGQARGGGNALANWPQERATKSPQSGRFAGTPYANIPIEELQKWASGSSPNRYAVAELNFRMPPPPAGQQNFQPGYQQGGYQ